MYNSLRYAVMSLIIAFLLCGIAVDVRGKTLTVPVRISKDLWEKPGQTEDAAASKRVQLELNHITIPEFSTQLIYPIVDARGNVLIDAGGTRDRRTSKSDLALSYTRFLPIHDFAGLLSASITVGVSRMVQSESISDGLNRIDANRHRTVLMTGIELGYEFNERWSFNIASRYGMNYRYHVIENKAFVRFRPAKFFHLDLGYINLVPMSNNATFGRFDNTGPMLGVSLNLP